MSGPAAGGERRRLARLAPWGLLAAGALVATLALVPYRSVTFERSDGRTVRLPDPRRLAHTSDAWDYLQLGRQLHRGEGFTSRFTYPPFLPVSLRAPAEGAPTALRETPAPCGVERFPLLWRQPGYPVLLAGAFAAAGGPEPDAALVLQGLALAVLPVATFLLARRLLCPGWAAAAGLLALLSPLLVSARAPIVATTWHAALLALLAAAFLSARRPMAWAGTGVLLGLTVLLRLETWLYVPGLLVLLALGRDRGRIAAAALVLGAALLVVLPWHVRLAQVTGDPFFNGTSLLFHATRAFPGWDSSRTLAVAELSPWAFVVSNPAEVLEKTALNLFRFGRDLALLPSPFLVVFLLLALALGLRRGAPRETRAFLAGTVVAALALVLALAPMEYAPRFLAGLVPWLTVGAVLGLARASRGPRFLAATALLVGLVLVAGALRGREGNGTALVAARDLDAAMQGSGGERLAACVALADAPTVYAWIWDRPAVWTPLPGDVPEVLRLVPGAAAVFTRAMGRGDSFDPGTIDAYRAAGGRAASSAAPVVLVWDRAP